jgi:hypothetical protein
MRLRLGVGGGIRRRVKRKGVAVVDVMVGVVVLTIGLLGVAGMLATATRRASSLGNQSSRDAIVLQELNRIGSLPYDTLATRVGCSTATSGTMSYTRCLTVTDITSGDEIYKRVRIILTPSATYSRPETVYVNRAKGAPTNPLGQ